jgi:RNA polymerase sigma factor (sigma-70 family)
MKVLLRTQSDARLVALARAGHDRAFEAIVERYRRPLLRACRRILPEARAEDALQQALVAAWTALRRGDEVSDLRPWLYKVVRNTALNQLRVTGYDFDELVETLAAADDPGDEIERRALVRQTLAAVAGLPERQRDALLRTAIEGRGQDEVARDLGLTDTALRQLVHRARASVRAAATAVVPLPLAAWLAAAAPRAEPMAARIAELVAGSGAAGATLAKAGTVAVLAGGAVSAPTLVDRPPAADRAVRERPEARAEVTRAPAAPVEVVAPTPTPEPKPVRAVTPAGGDKTERRDDRSDGERRRDGDRDVVRRRGDEEDERGDDDEHGDDERDRPDSSGPDEPVEEDESSDDESSGHDARGDDEHDDD